jgi:predicted nucleic-acid-binding protein
MIALDSNVIIRYLVQDDVAQSARATHLIEEELSEAQQGFVTLIVLVETGWVLKRLYSVNELEWRQAVRDLLQIRQLAVESRDLVAGALARLGSKKGDLADALVTESSTRAGCSKVVTFDRQAVASGMTLLK